MGSINEIKSCETNLLSPCKQQTVQSSLACNKMESSLTKPASLLSPNSNFLTRRTPSLASCDHFVGSVSSSSDLQAADPPFPLSLSLHFSECSFQMTSRASQGTKPLFFPLATLMKPLRSHSLLTQI